MQLYTIVTGEVISNTPQITLLSILPGSYKNIKKGLLRHWVIAARLVILRHWRSTQSPSVNEWVVEMDHTEKMETLLAYELDILEKCRQIWVPWRAFRESTGN